VSDTELRLERLIAAPADHVFALWTEPDLVLKWWGPDGYEIPASTFDVRPGGHWRTTFRSREGKLITVSGVYRLIEPPRRLVFTWAWHDDGGGRGHETEVTITLDTVPGGTRLVLVQQPFATVDSRDRHRNGWTSSLDRLARAAA